MSSIEVVWILYPLSCLLLLYWWNFLLHFRINRLLSLENISMLIVLFRWLRLFFKLVYLNAPVPKFLFSFTTILPKLIKHLFRLGRILDCFIHCFLTFCNSHWMVSSIVKFIMSYELWLLFVPIFKGVDKNRTLIRMQKLSVVLAETTLIPVLHHLIKT